MLARPAYGTVRLHTLLRRSQTACCGAQDAGDTVRDDDYAGQVVQRDTGSPDPITHLLLACGHGSLTASQVSALTDAGQRLSPSEWEQVRQRARHHRLSPLVFKHTAEAGLLAVMPAAVREALKAEYCATLVANRALQIELSTILDALQARHVEAIPLKGVSLATRYYPELALRPTSDIDLLVRPSQVPASIQALETLGYVPHRGSETLAGKHALRFLEHQLSKPNGRLVELHTTLSRAPSYASGLDVSEVWSRSAVCQVDGRSVRCLAYEDELRYLCLHFAVQHDSTRWFWLVDIAQMVDALPPTWNWTAFVDDTIALGLASPVAATIHDAVEKLGLGVPGGELARMQAAAVSPRERAAWKIARSEFAAVGRVSRHILMLHGLNAKLAFIGEIAHAGISWVEHKSPVSLR